nr:tRNA (adenosine(37)-N6)-threonylcarbamoyltransferase complex dimerization subunit type 1 TsaB [Oceanococcus sp. HetDA_MAG_MS8]
MSHRLIAVDSSNAHTSLVASEDGELCWSGDCDQRDNLGWLRHSLSQALTELGWERSSVDALAVSHGPGALTGVRVGVGFVQAYAMGLQRPVHAVNTLAALAASTQRPDSVEELKVALDARMGQLYAARINLQSWAVLDEQLAEPAPILRSWGAGLYAGPGWAVYAEQLSAKQRCISGVGPHARGVAIASHAVPAQPAHEVQVHYLRRQVARVPERVKLSTQDT